MAEAEESFVFISAIDPTVPLFTGVYSPLAETLMTVESNAATTDHERNFGRSI